MCICDKWGRAEKLSSVPLFKIFGSATVCVCVISYDILNLLAIRDMLTLFWWRITARKRCRDSCHVSVFPFARPPELVITSNSVSHYGLQNLRAAGEAFTISMRTGQSYEHAVVLRWMEWTDTAGCRGHDDISTNACKHARSTPIFPRPWCRLTMV